MAGRPPREGARWGEDPAPAPIIPSPVPEITPSDYEILCIQYGKDNVDKAIDIFKKTKSNFPELDSLNQGEISFARVVLNRATFSMQKATRVHALPETLDYFYNILPNWLAAGSMNRLELFFVKYPDEPNEFKKWIIDNWVEVLVYAVMVGAIIGTGAYFFLLNWLNSTSTVFYFSYQASEHVTLVCVSSALLSVPIAWIRYLKHK